MSTNAANIGLRPTLRLVRAGARLVGLAGMLALTYGGTCTISATHDHEHCHGSHHHHGCPHSTAAATEQPGLFLESFERSTFVDASGELVEVVRVAGGPHLPVRQVRADALRHRFARALLSSNPRLFAGDPAGELAGRGVFETPQGFLATWVREVENEGAGATQVPGYRLQLAFDSEGRLTEIERRRGLFGFAATLAR